MAYRFEHVEHQVYKNTFLKDVRIAVEFAPIGVDAVDADKMQAFLNKFDGAKIQVGDFLRRGNINIFSSNHEIDFRFSLGYAEAKMCMPPYTSFEKAWSFWVILEDFLKAMGVKEVKNLVIRKYNALYFKSDNKNYDIREVMGGLFCDELMSMIPADVGTDIALNGFERTWTENDEESRTAVDVVYGIKKADSVEKNDHLTLVTLVRSDGDPIPVEDVLKRANEYNQILFDVFHWCVKKDIINSMK